MSELYDDVATDDWFEELTQHDSHNRRHLLSVFSLFGTPSTMLDVGCGTGITVKTARQLGVEAFGVDQLCGDEDVYDPGWFFHADLRKQFSLSEHGKPAVVDLVLCLEVAEHIPSDNTAVFINTLANHLKRSDNAALVFTAAHPGQGGISHETERSAQFWRDRFYERGLNYQRDQSVNLALLWSNMNSPLSWLAANVQVFKR